LPSLVLQEWAASPSGGTSTTIATVYTPKAHRAKSDHVG
jgi:hypothetical protein